MYIGALRTITLEVAEQAINKSLPLKPGQKLCPKCRQIVSVLLEDSSETDEEISALDKSVSIEEERCSVSEVFSTIGVSSLKSHSQPMVSKVTAGKRKLSQAFSSMQTKVAKALDVPVSCLETQPPPTPNVEIQEKALAFDNLMSQIKEKLTNITDSKLKIQILTLVPTTWSIARVSNYFKVSEYLVHTAHTH